MLLPPLHPSLQKRGNDKRDKIARLRGNELLKHRLQLGWALDDFPLGVDRDEGGGAFDDQALAGCFSNRVGKGDGGFA